MKKTIEQSLLDRILYIGTEVPESFIKDDRQKFIVLGTPQEVIDETVMKKEKSNFEIGCWIAEYSYTKANPDGKFSEPPSMVYEQVARDFNNFLTS